ncbi:OLC1v1009243C1 [Oldenlandia corymbosa var. corymbosa]|uniref:OLC1v1009243C1 n=1 Tax=Oldenlandia corymbosa var. corymbosa TaxID=529605 RepID=A0AAV1DNI6_OLDCO|nr:OLC1v1009243C1 [Oldenlandia corymbosa var. corymbosa]
METVDVSDSDSSPEKSDSNDKNYKAKIPKQEENIRETSKHGYDLRDRVQVSPPRLPPYRLHYQFGRPKGLVPAGRLLLRGHESLRRSRIFSERQKSFSRTRRAKGLGWNLILK